MPTARGNPIGGTLDEDNFFPPCPSCDRNQNGMFTEKHGDNISWLCVKCGTSWDRRTGRIVPRPGRGANGRWIP